MITLLLLMVVQAATVKAQAAEGDVDVNELVFGHIGDAYEWHRLYCVSSPSRIS